MCGIVGVVGSGVGDRSSRVRAAVSALEHRGPDGAGMFTEIDVLLGHTRLAVIDPTSSSDQPMTDEASGCTIVFNGEIYNYRELRTELENTGARFRSAGDTEVLLRAYLRWGEDCVGHLNGMFAFAVWDPRRNHVFVARDRLGEKPLHLMHQGDAIWFASELKAFRAADLPTSEPDEQYIARFLAHGDLGDATATPLAGVAQLPPGHAAIIGPEGMRIRQYWTPSPAGVPAVDVYSEFAELFHDAVRLRLRSDVPLGTSLSGGLDSSLVLATVRSIAPDADLHAFTASFPGSDADELPLAAAVAGKLGVTLHPVPLGGDDAAADLDAMIAANEGPVESPSTFAQFRVMRAAHESGITVLLDGQGADETWAGYDKHVLADFVDAAATFQFARLGRSVRDWRALRGGLPLASGPLVGGLVAGCRPRTAAARLCRAHTGWLGDGVRTQLVHCDPIAGVDGRPARGELAGRLLEADLTRITLPRLLRYADRNSMAWSREVRLPFLDHRLVELASRTPVADKIVGGWTKEPVRRALEDLGLGQVARRRDKKGYMPPVDDWMRHRELAQRTEDAWSELRAAGLVNGTPAEAPLLARWRALAVHTWSEQSAVALKPALR